MKIKGLIWTSDRIEHIRERHGIYCDEVEEACELGYWIRKGQENRYLVYGQTENGRYLLVVLKLESNGIFKVITARDMTNSERHLYLRRRKE
jgi:uncharacterized DUF497 family protein